MVWAIAAIRATMRVSLGSERVVFFKVQDRFGRTVLEVMKVLSLSGLYVCVCMYVYIYIYIHQSRLAEIYQFF